MYNKFMKPSELNVTIGARVAVNGYYGKVTEVFKGIDAENNDRIQVLELDLTTTNQ